MAHLIQEKQQLQNTLDALTGELRDLEVLRHQLQQEVQAQREQLLGMLAEVQARRDAIVAELHEHYLQACTALTRAKEQQLEEIKRRLRVARSPWRKLLAFYDWQYRRELLYRIATLKRELHSPPRTEEQRMLQREMERTQQEWQEVEQLRRTGGVLSTSETRAHEHALVSRERHLKHIKQAIKEKEDQLAHVHNQLRALPDPERDFGKHFIAALRQELNLLTPAHLGIGV
ncbi:hypothetical protein [Ktedonospora formicarum]|uniref:Uncharacterized protein n=1 Tax=Ktedonospora formicarum TaxID=2778364 RepID=A0A8J3ID55_9CHLR|nr:hypothetical protein [Ktedonospora formicarum]GHO49164.1 hypothetical protein KSX_73270 [Ktedonospora formicarum]